MVKCPHCGFEGSEGNFRLMRSPWKYRFLTVKRFECPKCGENFRLYSGTSPKGVKVEFYIPKPRDKEVMLKEENEHNRAVQMLGSIGEVLGFHVKIEESSPDELYRFDCVWRDQPGHGPLKVFEVEFSGRVDIALARLAHAYDLWHPEQLYIVIADERDRERVKRLVEPRIKGAFARISSRVVALSVEDVETVYRSLCSNEATRRMIQQLSRRS